MDRENKMILRLLGAVAVIGTGVYAVGKLRKASQLTKNLFVDAKPSGFSRSGATINITFDVSITNYSGFNLNVKNMFSVIQLKSKDGQWVDAGRSNIIPALSFKDKETAPKFSLKMGLSAFSTALQLINGGISEIQIITYYDFAGNQLSDITKVDVAALVKAAKAKLGLFGIDEVSPEDLAGVVNIPLTMNGDGIYAMI